MITAWKWNIESPIIIHRAVAYVMFGFLLWDLIFLRIVFTLSCIGSSVAEPESRAISVRVDATQPPPLLPLDLSAMI
jgi:hypothetical protein